MSGTRQPQEEKHINKSFPCNPQKTRVADVPLVLILIKGGVTWAWSSGSWGTVWGQNLPAVNCCQFCTSTFTGEVWRMEELNSSSLDFRIFPFLSGSLASWYECIYSVWPEYIYLWFQSWVRVQKKEMSHSILDMALASASNWYTIFLVFWRGNQK